MTEFYAYFKENMEALGLPAPETLFGTLESSVGRAAAIIAVIEKMGPKVTISEVIGAGTRLEWLAVIGSMSAAFYVGAVIGSIAVATGRSISGGTSISDVFFVMRRYHLETSWLRKIILENSSIYNRNAIARGHYYARGLIA